MFSKVFFICYLLLIQTFVIQSEDNVTESELKVKGKVYDINLYITVPFTFAIFALIICLCLLCIPCRETPVPQNLTSINPVIVENTNRPQVVSVQSNSHISEGEDQKGCKNCSGCMSCRSHSQSTSQKDRLSSNRRLKNSGSPQMRSSRSPHSRSSVSPRLQITRSSQLNPSLMSSPNKRTNHSLIQRSPLFETNGFTIHSKNESQRSPNTANQLRSQSPSTQGSQQMEGTATLKTSQQPLPQSSQEVEDYNQHLEGTSTPKTSQQTLSPTFQALGYTQPGDLSPTQGVYSQPVAEVEPKM